MPVTLLCAQCLRLCGVQYSPSHLCTLNRVNALDCTVTDQGRRKQSGWPSSVFPEMWGSGMNFVCFICIWLLDLKLMQSPVKIKYTGNTR